MSKIFNPAKKGEIHEMQQELESNKIDKQRNALKLIIGAMTVGKDVSMLFPNVVKCIQTTDLELKKLVYLYIMNYAKSEPDLCILAVNTFVQDCTRNPNPLIRALAIRTMGCIRVPKIVEYLYQPLKISLKDEDPYVRKTAAICVAKLYDLSPETVTRQGFIDILVGLLGDNNPMVISNALTALLEIDETGGGNVFTVTPQSLGKLLAALIECSEWGKISIFNALSKYVPRDSREAEGISERLTAYLQHSNTAVVLGAIRVLMAYLDHINSQELVRTLTKKMSGPLITLLSKEHEIQYVALRNIMLILQKRPNLLEYDMKVFFCKYKDPIYVKMEKLEIIIMLVNDRNIDQVLLEFKEYATAADIEFVRRAVRAIGRFAIKLESAAEKCIHVLLELIENGYNPVVQESIIVIKDIFRKYPNRYESIIGTLSQNLDSLDEPEARAAMIWIIGEYAERISNAHELLFCFLGSFLDEPIQVQLQLLTATVKLFLKRPKTAATKQMITNILNLATKESDNPDLRERGYFYWRLLSDPKVAKSVVLAEKPLITDDTHLLDPVILNDLVADISKLSSIYHKPAESFSKFRKPGSHLRINKDTKEDDVVVVEPLPEQPQDLLNLSPLSEALNEDNKSTRETLPPKVLLAAEKGDGMQVTGAYILERGNLALQLSIQNNSEQPLGDFAMQLNVNVLGIALAAPLQVPSPLYAKQTANVIVPLVLNGPALKPTDPSLPFLQIALKNNVKVYYFHDILPYKLVLQSSGALERGEFLGLWRSLPEANEVAKEVPNCKTTDPKVVKAHLADNHIFFVADRALPDNVCLYHSAKLEDVSLLVEFSFKGNADATKSCTVSVRTSETYIIPKFFRIVESLLAPPI